MTSEEAIKTVQEMEKAIRTGKAKPVVQSITKEDGSTSFVTTFFNKDSALYIGSKKANNKAKNLQKENERLELLLCQVCAYCFGMNRKEHKKYILGE